MKEKILYTPHEIQELIEKNSVALIDIRDPGPYKEGHIQGAANIPGVFYYLSKSTPEGLAELYQEFTELFSQAGVSGNKTAIVYEDSLDTRYGGSCRGYWMLKYLGHTEVGILDGGLSAWIEADLPLESGEITHEPVEFPLNPQSNLMATKEDVLQAISDPSVVFLDNRDEPEWLGESSSPYGIDYTPRKGRIPGARWIEWYEFMDRSLDVAAFKPKEEIQALCAKQGIYPNSNIIIYCFKGARASNTYVALKEAGFKNLRVYFASWDEWSRVPDLPIEEGPPNR